MGGDVERDEEDEELGKVGVEPREHYEERCRRTPNGHASKLKRELAQGTCKACVGHSEPPWNPKP